METRLADNFGTWRTFLRIRVGVMYVSETCNGSSRAIDHCNFLVIWAWGIGMEKLIFGGYMVCGTGVYYSRVIINFV